LPGSPAIDRLPMVSCGVRYDQVFTPRPQGPACDSGAYELKQVKRIIDIKPKAANNTITSTQTRIGVAILSNSSFNAPNAVVRNSLTFGRTGSEASLARTAGGAPACGANDVNGDGRLDLVCNFVVSKTGFVCGDTSGYLKGLTKTGVLFFGKDRIVLSGCS
jgi:hypothetical protein